MKNIPILPMFCLFIILFSTSCNIQEFDIPDDEISDISLQDQLTGSLIQTAYNQVAIPERTTNILIQYLEENDFSGVQIKSYNFVENYFSNYWNDGLYNGSLKSSNNLLLQAKAEGNTNLEAIAKIILALEFGNATSAFGDIPYSEALRAEDGIIEPKYDSQEEIYLKIIDLLKEATTTLSNETINNIQQNDVFANGDLQRWKYLANGLLARYSLHLSTKSNTNYERAITYVEQSFPSLTEQIVFTFNENADIEHPLHAFGIQRPGTYRGNTKFIEKLENNNDPRRNSYFDLEGKFENQFWSRIGAFVPIVSYVELQFIKAESELMTNASDATVSTTLANAIRASFEQMNISDEMYILNHSDLSEYTSKEAKLEHIINEAYYSYYGYAAQQSWNNYRRLGYPRLTLTGNSNVNNPDGVLPKRFLYPASAFDFNASNLQDARDNQNGALLDNPIWLYK